MGHYSNSRLVHIVRITGVGYLLKTNANKNIVQTEDSDVVGFLDKNTKTNIHGGAGFLIGWKF